MIQRLRSGEDETVMIVNSNNDLEVEIIMEKTCCFTGHRPEKITENVDVIKANLKK